MRSNKEILHRRWSHASTEKKKKKKKHHDNCAQLIIEFKPIFNANEKFEKLWVEIHRRRKIYEIIVLGKKEK